MHRSCQPRDRRWCSTSGGIGVEHRPGSRHDPCVPATISLVVTDLDGTLWHTDGSLHPQTARALSELERRNVPVLVATGRRTRSTRTPLARLGFAPPAIVMNGAVGLQLATGARFHLAPFTP